MKKIIIFLICFYGAYANAQPYMLDQIVAFVGSKAIKQSDVENAYLQARAMGYPVRGDMKCNMFEDLLVQKLLVNQAEVDSLVVEPSEVEMEMNRKLEHFIQQIGSQEKLEDYFKKSIFEIKDDLRILLYEQKLAGRMQHSITENVKITPSEVRNFFNRIHKDSIPEINGQARVAQIVIYPPYSEDAISDVRQKLLDMRRRIVDGESTFRTQAVLFSECPSSRQGGDMGFANRSDLDPEFAKVAWALKNPGDVSRIVESKFGFHIIQLIDRRGDQVNVRHILLTPKLKPEDITSATSRLDSIAQLIRTEKISWNAAALFYSHDEKTRFNGGLMINPRDFGTYFEMDQFEPVDFEVIRHLKKIGEISSPYQSRDDDNRIVYKIIKLQDQTDPHRASLKTDYNFLQDLALNEKMNKVIKAWVEEKIESSYIYIEDSFKRCRLSNNWMKQ